MDRKLFLIGAVILGLFLGFSASYLVDSSPGECEKVQDEIRAGQNFTGTVSCYPPGAIEADIPDRVENQTELKCVCRKINDNHIQLFPILETG